MTDSVVNIPGVSDLVEIGRGGFGVVYRGRELDLDRPVAVKVLPISLDQRARDRFDRERRALGTLSGHPNIVTIYRAGVTDGGNPYLVMELLEGGAMEVSLRERGAVPWDEVLALGVSLAGAVETAHRAGVLHRDIKPGNVLMSAHGDPKLADFGIARLQGAPETRSAAITASINHAAPEIIDGKPPSQASDVYALASTLFELIGGHAPFARPGDESIISVLARIARDPVPDLRLRGIPDIVSRVLEQGMAKDPTARPLTAQAFGELLRDAQRQLGRQVTNMKIEGEASQYSALAGDPSSRIPAPLTDSGPLPPASPSTADPLLTAAAVSAPLPQPPAAVAAPSGPLPTAPTPPEAPPAFAPPQHQPPPGATSSGSIPLQPPAAPARRGKGMLVGVGAAVLLAGGVGVFVVTGGGGADPGGDNVVAANATPTATVAVEESPTAVPPPSATPLPTATPTPTPSGAPPTSTPAAPTPTPAAPTPTESGGGLGSQIPDGGDADYPAYDTVSDATGAITLDIPAAWTDRVLDGGGVSSLQAAVTLSEAFGDDAFDSPGVSVAAVDPTLYATTDAALDAFVEAECEAGERGDITVRGWVGRYALYSCPRGAVVDHIYAVSPDGTSAVFMGIQLLLARDLAATQRMVSSITIDPALMAY